MPLTAAEACTAQIDYSQLQRSESGLLGWLESGPHTGGCSRLMIQQNGTTIPITPEELSIGSRVHEYGGRSWCFGPESVYFVARTDQQIYHQCLSAKVSPNKVTHSKNSRFLEPCYHALNDQIIAVEEIHNADSVINRLVRIDPSSGKITPLHEGFDFYSSITLSPDGSQLAWISWNHPNQPWTATRLLHAHLNGGQLSECRTLAGNFSLPESLQMPRFDANGRLWVISDRNGYWNLYNYDFSDRSLIIQQAALSDVISSPWMSGLRQYEFNEEGGLLSLRFRPEGVFLIDQGSLISLPGINHIRELCIIDSQLYMIAAGPDNPPSLIRLELSTRRMTAVAQPKSLPTEPLSQPQLICFEVDEDEVSGYYYAPLIDAQLAPPPLLITLHGGPTSASYPIYNPQIQFWCSQGFAVFDLNYRGSSNQGRAYRYKLCGRWGLSEVRDIAASLKHLIYAGKADPNRLFIRGRSSGGYSALMALCENLGFTAATSYFGVTDPLSLATSTHKFESHYLDWLLGIPLNRPDIYQSRSPLQRAAEINTPILFLQGEQDRVVTPDQTAALYQTLTSRGVPAKVHYFPNEGHGFRENTNQIKSLELELAFYQAHFDLQPE